MRITDLPVTTPLTASKAREKRTEDAGQGRTAVVTSARAEGAQHPDEVASAALHKAASAAQASRVVAAENQRASDSVRGDFEARVFV